MLKSLKLEGVGPVSGLSATFGERLNIFTGDNGLGKSFLLDVCFWSLTGTWPGGRTAMPTPSGRRVRPTITYEIKGKSHQRKEPKTSNYDFSSQTWTRARGRPFKPGLVIYASVDGSFSVWDPARNYWRDTTSGTKEGEDLARAYQFTPETLAAGLPDGSSEGLVRDWVNWFNEQLHNSSSQSGNNSPEIVPFELMADVVKLLSHPLEPMTCGEPKRVYVDQPRKYPVLMMPYGEVVYPHWSAGVRRIISFAYLLVWTWYEHVQAAHLRNEEPENRLVLIVDEIEAHLHPKWQRTILPALLQVANKLQERVNVQVFAATHSPLILASLEAHFDKDMDKLFWFDLHGQAVQFRDYPWAIQGDVVSWLTSEIFGLRQARSREGEVAVEAAEAFMRGDLDNLPEDLKSKESIHRALKKALPGLDPFWPRWVVEVRP